MKGFFLLKRLTLSKISKLLRLPWLTLSFQIALSLIPLGPHPLVLTFLYKVYFLTSQREGFLLAGCSFSYGGRSRNRFHSFKTNVFSVNFVVFWGILALNAITILIKPFMDFLSFAPLLVLPPFKVMLHISHLYAMLSLVWMFVHLLGCNSHMK